jgi:hypothetical protein
MLGAACPRWPQRGKTGERAGAAPFSPKYVVNIIEKYCL